MALAATHRETREGREKRKHDGQPGPAWEVHRAEMQAEKVIETGRPGNRWLERVVGKQPEKQTDNQREREAASRSGRGRQGGRRTR